MHCRRTLLAIILAFLNLPGGVAAAPLWTGDLIVEPRSESLAGSLSGARAIKSKRKIYRMRAPDLDSNQGIPVSPIPLDRSADPCKSLYPVVSRCEPDIWIETAQIPNDPFFSNLEGLVQIGAPQAWNVATDAAETVIAVLDTGIDIDHPDLEGNIWKNPGELKGDGIDNDGNGYIDDLQGYDFFNGDPDPSDDHGHSTHVAGILGARGDNHLGISGVVWKTRIIPLKCLGAAGGGPLSSVLEALDYLLELRKTYGLQVVINASWGGNFTSSLLIETLHSLNNAGILLIAAAGNGGEDSDYDLHLPSGAAVENIISVAAVDPLGHLAPFSNYGVQSVDLGAPGVDIYSSLPDGGYGVFSGSSMATAYVSGAAALVWARYPALTHQKIRSRILQTARKSGLPLMTGGILDLAAAIGATGDVSSLSPLRIRSIRDRKTGAKGKVFPGRRFTLDLRTGSKSPEEVLLHAGILGVSCAQTLTTASVTGRKKLKMRLPKLPAGKIKITAVNGSGESDSRNAKIMGKKSPSPLTHLETIAGACQALASSLK